PPAASPLPTRRSSDLRTEPAGVVSIRIYGDAAVDLCAVRRGDCRAGGAGLRGVFDGVAHERGPGEAAGSEQDSDRATGPGKFAQDRKSTRLNSSHQTI